VSPFIAQAVFSPRGPVYSVVKTTLTLTDVDGKPITKPFVQRNTPFTISWDTVGIKRGEGSFSSKEGIKCVNNWGEKEGADGSDTGSISEGRLFAITCMGIGAGWKITPIINIGLVDLTVPNISLSPLEPKLDAQQKKIPDTYFIEKNGELNINASVKNAGNIRSPLFGIDYYVSTNRNMTPKSPFESRNLPGLEPGATVEAPKLPAEIFFAEDLPTGSPGLFYQVCADSENKIFEEGRRDENNCSPVIGPYKFVQ
jgi:hypothetical protein